MRRLVRNAWQRSPAENFSRLYFKLNPSERNGILKLPTVNDWWQLARKYPDLCRLTHSPIKDFGYLTVLDYLARERPGRVLEFGHGLRHNGANLLYDRNEPEMWACDDYQGLAYSPEREEWESRYSQLVSMHPQTRFVRCLLGEPERTRELLPENYFDLVCSVSVIEELKPEILAGVLAHAHRLLSQDGRLLCSYDVRVHNYRAVDRLIHALEAASFEWYVDGRLLPYTDWDTALLESQISVILKYQSWQGDARRYQGNWTTIIVDARKRQAN